MKRSNYIILSFILSFISMPLAAQPYIEIRAGLDFDIPIQVHHLDKDLSELKNFQQKTDRLIFLAERGRWRKAQRIKRSLLRDMKREIRQSQHKVKTKAVYHPRGNAYGLYKKRGKSKFNKRRRPIQSYRGQGNYFRELLRQQRRLYRELKRLHLGYGRDGWSSVELHAQVLYDFEYTMEEQLNSFSSSERRRRTRRNR